MKVDLLLIFKYESIKLMSNKNKSIKSIKLCRVMCEF